MSEPQMGRSSKRLNGKRRFLITGYDRVEKDRLSSVIKRLGGEYSDDREFTEQCTHLVCEVPNRSEKFLGACATGKWIVRSSYLDACIRAGSWISEEPYEWTDVNLKQVKAPFLYRAPRRWRTFVRDTGRLAFDGWRVILIIDDSNMKLVFRRLLDAGGALAILLKLPPKVDRNITHIFVKTKQLKYEYLKPWKAQGIPCLAPDYIGDFLVEDELPPLCSRDIFLAPKSMKKDGNREAKTNGTRTSSRNKLIPDNQSQESSCVFRSRSNSANISLAGTPAKASPHVTLSKTSVKVDSRDSPCSSTSVSKPESSVAEIRLPCTPIQQNGNGPSSGNLQRLVIKIEPSDSSTETSDSSDESQKSRGRVKKDENNNAAIKTRRSYRTQRVDYKRMSCGKITPTETEKKRDPVSTGTDVATETSFTEETTSLYGASPRRASKRQQSRDENPAPMKRVRRYEDLLVTSDQQTYLRHRHPVTSSLPVSLNVEEMFNTCHEEAYYHKAVEEFQKYLNCRNHPTADMVWKMMAILFTSSDRQFSDTVYMSLRRLLTLHPPSGPCLQLCYQRSLELANNDWEFLMTTIESCKGENFDGGEGLDLEQQTYNSTLLLEYLAALFAVNLVYCETSSERMTPLIYNLLWTSTGHGELNYRVYHLMSLAVDATKSNENPKLRRLFYSLVISSFRALQFVCKETQLNTEKSERFIAELTKKLSPQTCSFDTLEIIIDCLRNTRLGIGIFSFTLDTLDNIVFMDRCRDISLGKILGHYLFCIPKKVSNRRRVQTNGDGTKRLVAPLNKAAISNINKTNMKGETKLHRACIKGDSTTVRQLLKVPGIDINKPDFAGWTALHEACNAGHLECVQLLLDYKSRKTIESYFSPTPKKRSGVDLYSKSLEDGTTPLHDAVINNKIEVVRLLIEYGGRTLLEETDYSGRTPVQYAESDGMVDALIPLDETDGPSSSQMDCSQVSTQSEDMNELYDLTDNVNCTSVQECRRFLLLFECLLNSYLHVKDLYPTRSSEAGRGDRDDQNCLRRFPKYIQKLKRHVQKILVEDVKESVAFPEIFQRFEILAESYTNVYSCRV